MKTKMASARHSGEARVRRTVKLDTETAEAFSRKCAGRRISHAIASRILKWWAEQSLTVREMIACKGGNMEVGEFHKTVEYVRLHGRLMPLTARSIDLAGCNVSLTEKIISAVGQNLLDVHQDDVERLIDDCPVLFAKIMRGAALLSREQRARIADILWTNHEMRVVNAPEGDAA